MIDLIKSSSKNEVEDKFMENKRYASLVGSSADVKICQIF